MEGSTEDVKLLIRCALQSFEDTSVTCPLDWTVRELKEHLSTVCSSKPEAGRQRLIYAGHCLQDDRTLRSILQSRVVESDVYVVHLVCPPKDVAHIETLRKRKTTRYTGHRGNEGSSRQSGGNSQGAAVGQPAPSPSAASGQWTQFPMPAGYPLSSQLGPNSQFQNAYQAYMTSYANYMNQMMSAMGGNPQNAFAASAAAFNSNYFMMSQFAQSNAQQLNNAQQAAGAAVPNGVGMQEAPAAADDALPADVDIPQRDFLDIVYKAIRMCFLVMLVYVYSSAERFLGVLLFILVVWFVQARRDRNNRQRADRQLANAVDNVRRPIPADGADSDYDSLEDGDGSTEDGNDHHEHSAWNVFWSTCYTFITSFFISLIPENPVPVNVN